MIRRWMFKAAVQKGISFLPYAHRINLFFQKTVTRGVLLDEPHFFTKLGHGADHTHYFYDYTKNTLMGKTCLELGSGWYPVIPLCCFLKGADKILSYDISPLMNRASILQTVRMFLENEPGVRRLLGDVEPARWERIAGIAAEAPEMPALAERLGLELRVEDVRRWDVPPSSIDLVTSNNTFEHIYADALPAILQNLWTALRPGGLMSHFIDLSDHFAHFDPAISIYNFLQFTDRQWALIDNSIQPQNRLRWKHYRAIYDELDIPHKPEKVRPGNPEIIRQLPLAPEFQGMSAQDLAVSHGYFLSHKITFIP